MLKEAALPPLQSFIDGPSTVFCVAARHRKTRQSTGHSIAAEKNVFHCTLTSNGVDSSHETLNNTESIIDYLRRDVFLRIIRYSLNFFSFFRIG